MKIETLEDLEALYEEEKQNLLDNYIANLEKGNDKDEEEKAYSAKLFELTKKYNKDFKEFQEKEKRAREKERKRKELKKKILSIIPFLKLKKDAD